MPTEARAKRLARLGWFLSALVAVAALEIALWSWRGGAQDEPLIPHSSPDEAYTLVGGRPFLFRDQDRNGSVDCVGRVGPGAFLGGTKFAAEGTRGCSGLLGSTRPLPDDLRELMTRALREKDRLDLSHGALLDADGDGRWDCVVSVHAPQWVAIRRGQDSCGSLEVSKASLADADRAAQLDALWPLEQQIQTGLAHLEGG